MGRILSGSKPTGSADQLSYYTRKDLDGTFVRAKGGPSKELIETQPAFETTRKNNREFGGRSGFTRMFLRSLKSFKPLCDYNIAGPLNALLKQVQVLDTETEFGKRAICLSRSPGI